MASNYLYLTGGEQKLNKFHQEQFFYQKARVVRLNLDDMSAENLIDYSSPPDCIAEEESSVMFKSGYLKDDLLYVCTTTEVMIYDLKSLERIAYLTHPCFNDVHHVLPVADNRILVTSTGLDALFEMNWQGEILREWSASDKPVWESFDKNIDYRKIASTKPHFAHPNFTTFYEDEIWLTRFRQKEAICLTTPGKKIDIKHGFTHDGIVFNGLFYYTTVNGYIVVADPRTGKVVQSYNLNEIKHKKKVLGWCRGIKVLDEDRVIVGFTRIRLTKFQANISWLKNFYADIAMLMPTRIAAYNLKTKTLEWEFDLEPFKLNAVFSIL